ncbi:hypothetical protein M409DRAFT_22262 [Zasmidium cellare ATCC 36951]|uniref:Amidohydrolase-related domain-containing protein n=1 Tax=Zasmidium cellare ATCC 36951 TaxID=1080233 RepID=A0A6A6CJP7_ZASCE|nr:uncharacterized protein M409DRAFT_22262 [Zasmidium cellare ATCC 36951]KAF2167454.1 hypothetical protein M409DRAFT_22262 [Zasmidium cellare ATCC 36951]
MQNTFALLFIAAACGVAAFPSQNHSSTPDAADVWKHKKISLEEAFVLPELVEHVFSFPQPIGVSNETFRAQFLDIGPIRLQQMDDLGIDYMILSHTAPLAQGVNESDAAEALATRANDYLGENIKNNTDRLGGFAMLSLHDPMQAANELERAVSNYGFHGAFMYTYQDYSFNETYYLSDPRYDPLWQRLVDLDLPVYIHPRGPGPRQMLDYLPSTPDLIGGGYQFSNDVGLTLMKMIAYGVFDRFPSLKVISGHMGEHLPSDLFRLDAQVDRLRSALNLPALHDVSYYFQNNFYETTSGDFADDLLNFHIQQIGIERILFSVDYPYENLADGTKWLDNLTLPDGEKAQIARGNALKLLKLDG